MFNMFHRRHGRRFAHEADLNDRHDHRPRGPRSRGGLGRFFAHGDLRLLILHLIAEQPRHGYQIIKEIEDRVAGAYTPSPGVIYPTLTMLEEQGHVAPAPIANTGNAGESARKPFAITPEGRALLQSNRPALDAILARIDSAGHDRGAAPQVMRAMHNLRLALRLRLVRGPLDTAQAEAIAATLDAAALALERT